MYLLDRFSEAKKDRKFEKINKILNCLEEPIINFKIFDQMPDRTKIFLIIHSSDQV